jgi:hypothetical protein
VRIKKIGKVSKPQSNVSAERFSRHLIHRAVSGIFVGTPAQEFRPVTKAPASEVIEFHLDDKLVPANPRGARCSNGSGHRELFLESH